MNLDGKIAQIGTPKEIYEKPKTKFIANFVGNSTIFEGVLLSIKEGLGAIAIPDVGTVVAKVDSIENWMIPGMSLFLGVKPERVVISKEKKEKYDNCISGTLINSMYAGKYTQYAVKTTNDQEIIVFQSDEKITESNICEGDAVFLQFKSQHVVLLED
jgi:ABC-type Fe3+/spermidine/putrescine transport system ATPase subunit